MAKKIDPSTRHPMYEHHEEKVEMCYDAFHGCVREEEYVPRLSDQSNDDWEAYVSRPAYHNATERACQALIGALTRKDFVLTGVPDVNVCGSENLKGFYQDLIMDVAIGGRVFVIVDVYTADDGVPLEKIGQPYLHYFTSQQIINWSDDFVMVELTSLEEDPDNPFNQVEVTKWKEFYTIDVLGEDNESDTETPMYRTRIWYKTDKDKFVHEEPQMLLVGGNPLAFIPGWWANPYDNSTACYNPTLFNIAELNVSHFRLSCDKYQGLHHLALPTFTIVGDLATDENGNVQGPVKIGSTREALHLTQGSSASYTEFSGAGLTSVDTELKSIEDKMDAIGAKLVSQKAGVEAAQAVQLRANSEGAVLVTLTNALENALNGALAVYGDIIGTQVSITLNRDFLGDSATKADPMGSNFQAQEDPTDNQQND